MDLTTLTLAKAYVDENIKANIAVPIIGGYRDC